ncbi:unnamed protein product, partial [Rotaria sordida]
SNNPTLMHVYRFINRLDLFTSIQELTINNCGIEQIKF